jgi:membrane-associated phospholipid phosphatase
MATVYCMFHYAVDVIGGLLLGFFAILTFNRVGRKRDTEGTLRGKGKE